MGVQMRMLIVSFLLLISYNSYSNSALSYNYFKVVPFQSFNATTTHDRLAISFITNKAVKSTIRYTNDNKKWYELSDKSSTIKHVFKLSGLKEDTSYIYEIDGIYKKSFKK